MYNPSPEVPRSDGLTSFRVIPVDESNSYRLRAVSVEPLRRKYTDEPVPGFTDSGNPRVNSPVEMSSTRDEREDWERSADTDLHVKHSSNASTTRRPKCLIIGWLRMKKPPIRLGA